MRLKTYPTNSKRWNLLIQSYLHLAAGNEYRSLVDDAIFGGYVTLYNLIGQHN